MIEKGFCQCGCGEKTPIRKRTRIRRGWIKGEPCDYLHGHYGSCGVQNKHPKWNGGVSTVSKLYPTTRLAGHPRALSINGIKQNGYVRDHLLIAEKALGRPIPITTPVHHFPSVQNCSNLVICNNKAYHLLLHVRYRALMACGHPTWRRCVICKKYDDPINMVIYPRKAPFHSACRKEYRRILYRQKHPN